jgi:glycosyltransferase involved in cell wall biosynthesis
MIDRPLRIAMVGQRGVPATFGGVERHVEELGSRLAARGHVVTVYGRTNYVREPRTEYRGMRVRNLPTVNSKHLDAIVHSAISTLDAMRRGVDIVHYHAIGPGLPSFLPRYLSSAKVIQTVHGRDAERAKWGPAARTVLQTAEWLSAHVPDATIVVARNLAEHYGRTYRRRTWVIPNGVEPGERRPVVTIADRWDLAPGSYALFVGRLVPEKAPDMLVRAWRRLRTERKLVIAGGSSYTDDYVRSLERLAAQDERVVLAGYVFGAPLEELYANAAAFVLPSALEGLPLTLLEAAAYGTPIIASDIPPHLEVLDEDAPGHRFFRAGSERSLVDAIERSFEDPAAEAEGAAKLRDRVLETYRWDSVVDETERLYRHVLGSR